MLKKWVLCALIVSAPMVWSLESESLQIAKSRCLAESSNEPKLKNQDFRWGYDLASLAEAYKGHYESGKRLRHRAFF